MKKGWEERGVLRRKEGQSGEVHKQWLYSKEKGRVLVRVVDRSTRICAEFSCRMTDSCYYSNHYSRSPTNVTSIVGIDTACGYNVSLELLVHQWDLDRI